MILLVLQFSLWMVARFERYFMLLCRFEAHCDYDALQ